MSVGSHVSAEWSGARLRSVTRLALGTGVAAAALAIDVVDPLPPARQIYYVAAVVLWLALAVCSMAFIWDGGGRWAAWQENLASLLVLAGAVIAGTGIAGVFGGDIAVVTYALFLVIELRGVVQTSPAWYAALSIAGVTLVASLAMADVEATSPKAQISNVGEALLWSVSQVLRFGALVQNRPVTTEGEFLGVFVILSGVLFSAVLFSSITAWAVRQGQREPVPGERVRDEVRAVLLEAGLLTLDTTGEREDGRLWALVDVDDIVGRRRRTWLRSRRRAVSEYLASLPDDDVLIRSLGGDPGTMTVRCVLVSGTGPNLETDFAEPGRVVEVSDVSAWIEDHVVSGDVVVTNRPDLAKALADRGVTVVPGTPSAQ